MKKIFKGTFLGVLFISGSLLASAQYYSNYDYNNYTPYYNTYQNSAYSNSYIYTQGCYKYQYDRYTHITSLLGSTCNTNTYTYPTYQNTYTYQYQTYPYMYSYTYPTSQYYTYSYNNGYWYPGSSNYYNGSTYNYGYNYGYNYNNYNNNYGCYWSGGYQVCY